MRRFALRVPALLAVLLLVLFVVSSQHVRGQEQAGAPVPAKVFDLTVSLEWQPGDKDSLPNDLSLAGCPPSVAKARFLDDLVEGLRQTSAYLYTFSEGQMALGKVAIYTDGARWDTADIRVLANNAYRPTAFVGGIVDRKTNYDAATKRTVTFAPGAVYLSRLWNGIGARCGGWSEPAGWRTVGHEFAHYALYLFDEYYNESTHVSQYCSSGGLSLLSPGQPVPGSTGSANDSLMAYHYNADKLWLDGAPLPPSCSGTPQHVAHGESDWETVRDFYGVPKPVALANGPTFAGSPAEPLFSAAIVPPAAPLPSTSADVALVPLPRPDLVGQTYLVHQEETPNGALMRVLGQGELLSGKRGVFFGVKEGDRAAVLVQNWLTGERSYYPEDNTRAAPLVVGSPNQLKPVPSLWRPAVTITPEVMLRTPEPVPTRSEVTGLKVQLHDCSNRTKRVRLRYCPAGGRCGQPVDVSTTAPTTSVFEHTFRFLPVDGKDEPPASYGYIHAEVLDTGEETIQWYQLAGGVGPVHIGGHAPLLDGLVNVDSQDAPSSPVSGAWSLYSPAQMCSNSGFTLPPNVRGVVGQPLRLQAVVLESGGQRVSRPWSAGDPPVLVRLAYNQDLLNQIGIDERQLVVLRLRGQGQEGQRWERMPIADQNFALDWISVRKTVFNPNRDGQGDIYALGYLASFPRAWLPLARR